MLSPEISTAIDPGPSGHPSNPTGQGKILAVWILAAKLPNYFFLNFALDSGVDFVSCFCQTFNGKGPPKSSKIPPQNSPGNSFGKTLLGPWISTESLLLMKDVRQGDTLSATMARVAGRDLGLSVQCHNELRRFWPCQQSPKKLRKQQSRHHWIRGFPTFLGDLVDVSDFFFAQGGKGSPRREEREGIGFYRQSQERGEFLEGEEPGGCLRRIGEFFWGGGGARFRGRNVHQGEQRS